MYVVCTLCVGYFNDSRQYEAQDSILVYIHLYTIILYLASFLR